MPTTAAIHLIRAGTTSRAVLAVRVMLVRAGTTSTADSADSNEVGPLPYPGPMDFYANAKQIERGVCWRMVSRDDGYRKGSWVSCRVAKTQSGAPRSFSVDGEWWREALPSDPIEPGPVHTSYK